MKMARRDLLSNGAGLALSVLSSKSSLAAFSQIQVNGPLLPSNWQSINISADGSKIFNPLWQGDYFNSQDTGASWISQTSLGKKQWVLGGCSSDGTVAYGAVQNGYLYKYSSGVWSQLPNQPGSSVQNWQEIRCSSDGTKVVAIVGSISQGDIWTSVDGGTTWVDQTGALTRNWTACDISGDGTKIIASNWLGQGPNGDGGVYISTNWQSGSPTWASNIFAANGAIFAGGVCYSRDGSTAYCAFNANGSTSIIYVTQNDGATWTPASPPVGGGNARSWNDVHCNSTGEVVVGVGYAAINNAWLSTNYGASGSWTNLPIIGGGWSALSDNGQVIAVSTYGGYINISQNGGSTFQVAQVHG